MCSKLKKLVVWQFCARNSTQHTPYRGLDEVRRIEISNEVAEWRRGKNTNRPNRLKVYLLDFSQLFASSKYTYQPPFNGTAVAYYLLILLPELSHIKCLYTLWVCVCACVCNSNTNVHICVSLDSFLSSTSTIREKTQESQERIKAWKKTGKNTRKCEAH